MAKQSVEEIKDQSNYLLGDLPEQLASEKTHFDDAGYQLLKFHGIYQQDDRDARKERKKQNLEELYFFMVRSKLPGGKMTAEQYLAHDELADKYANGTIRLTTRQGIQFHGIFKKNLKSHMRGLNDALVSTLAACGDVERNIMCCPAPIRDNTVRDEMQALTDRLSDHLCPKTSAYHELWLNGEKVHVHKQSADIEPIYGKHYLPRKFKSAVALPEDNCVDVLSNDLALVAKHDGKSIVGYDVYAGGGLGTSHGNAKTYPRLATPVCFATPDEVVDVSTAIVKVQRDHGNREDRKNARLKYTIDRLGQDKFRQLVSEYYGGPLKAHSGTPITGVDDHLGWHSQGDGKMWVGVFVLSGRLADTPQASQKTGLRDIVKKFRPNLRVTATQNILLCDIDPAVRSEVDAMLNAAGFRTVASMHPLMRNAMACPATPTCGLALAESERALPSILDIVHSEMASIGLSDEDITMHMTGCPNGCARPYNADIGLVGRQPGKYRIYIGGNKLGSALAFEWADLVPHADLGAQLRGPLLAFKQDRQPAEGFGDFCRRVGYDSLKQFATALGT